jgi:actin-related protein 2
MMDEYTVLNSDCDEKSLVFKSRNLGEVFIGHEARDKQSFLDLTRPVDKGFIRDWNDVELIVESVIGKLSSVGSQEILTPSNKDRKISSACTSIVLSDMYSTGSRQRERMLELMFESFNFERVNVSPSAALTLAGRGTSSGLVVDVGDSKSEIVPVISGFVQKGSVMVSDLAGRTVTERLIDLLRISDSANYKIDRNRDFFQIETIKENFCYAASDLGEERFLADTTNILTHHLELPDKTIVLNAERFLAPEILFQPRFMGDSDKRGISQLILDSVGSCPIDSRQALLRSVILTGGSTFTPGFGSRIEKDVLADHPSVHVDASPDRDFSAFIGGCAMARSAESNWWITRQEFKEKGAAACINRLFSGVRSNN